MKTTKLLLSSLLISSLTYTQLQAQAQTGPTESTQTVQGERPYGGMPPKGMSADQYAELEANLPDINAVSKEAYLKAINDGTQDIADKYNITITAPQQTFKPSGEPDVPYTRQGLRPYGGMPPKGMTSEQYTELEQMVPKLNEISKDEYSKLLDEATQKIADKYGVTIEAPQKTFVPHSLAEEKQTETKSIESTDKKAEGVETTQSTENVESKEVTHTDSNTSTDEATIETSNQTKSNDVKENTSNDKESTLPDTGEMVHKGGIIAGIIALLSGIGFLLFRKK
ncbi:LPXTG cell wall anchor domain-containing protein [Macrococcus animalis]|uniref:LPXTG cell wall anchor domain-containing protein n=1 Tax=Macrococcus animalis TaxID=3395467 RepID=UPI0039BDF35E